MYVHINIKKKWPRGAPVTTAAPSRDFFPSTGKRDGEQTK